MNPTNRLTPMDYLLSVVAVGAVAYHLLSIWVRVQSSLEYYYTHIALVVLIVCLGLLSENKRQGAWGKLSVTTTMLVMVLGLASCGYLVVESDELVFRQPFINMWDRVVAITIIGVIVTLVYRVWGAILASLMLFGVGYYAFGAYLTGPLHYESPDLNTVLTYLAGLGSERGILWAVPLSAKIIFLVIVFGGLLKGTRILEMFDELGQLLSQMTAGGVYYSAIAGTTAVGMVTGQPVANVALMGPIAVPPIKARGESPERAGAVVVLASLISQMLPPIMGLAGFLMAVTIGIPYIEVARSAIVPAFLYMVVLVIGVYFMAQASPALRSRFGETQARPAEVRRILWLLPSFIAGFGTLVWLLYLRYSAGYAAAYGMFFLTVASFIRPREYRPTLMNLLDGIRFGANSAASLGLILAGIGLLIQVLVTTGAGFEVGKGLMQTAGESLWLALFFAMLIAMFAGLGLPTPAAYAVVAVIVVPFLIDFGISKIAAHFFTFYFAIFSAITPPVAVACMASARIAGGSFYRTVWESLRIGAFCLIIPYAFVAYPALLDFPYLGWTEIVVVLQLFVVMVGWSIGMYGSMTIRGAVPIRMISATTPGIYLFMLWSEELYLGWIAVGVVVFCLFFQLLERRNREAAVPFTSDPV